MNKPTLVQINVVSGNLDASSAFYRRLAVDIPDAGIWITSTGSHHATATAGPADRAIALDLDSAEFAPHWNAGWKGRTDLSGRVVVGFGVPTRDDARTARRVPGRALCDRRRPRRNRRPPHESRVIAKALASA